MKTRSRIWFPGGWSDRMPPHKKQALSKTLDKSGAKMLSRIVIFMLGLIIVLGSSFYSLAGNAAQDEPYYMADVQATVNLPRGWKMLRWSDWDFKAESRDAAVRMRLFYTQMQVPPTVEAAKAWATLHVQHLKEQGAGDVQATNVGVAAVKGMPVAEMDLSFHFNGDGPKGFYRAMAIPGAGKVIHVATFSLARREGQARKALDYIVENLDIAKPAEPLDALAGKASSPAGFEVSLPDGWRGYAPSETALVNTLVSKTGQGKIDPERCWVAVKPVPIGDPDLMVFCGVAWFLEPIDDYSFKAIEKQVHDKFFGTSPMPVDPAEKIALPGRTAFLYSPSSPEAAIRMAVTPYDKGIMVGWGLAQKDHESELDAAFRSVLIGTRYTGPNNGVQKIAFAQWISYIVQYRSTDPLVIGPILLFMACFIFLLFKLGARKPPNYDEFDL